MSPTRPPAAPPELPGFDYVEVLGSGGFADVFLYRRRSPDLPVAVKVLLPDAVGREQAAQFEAEAQIMARLSGHPSIVRIYEAGTTGDGRPYLVMDYYSRPNLQLRYRREGPLRVDEALRVGVQIASAVETSHRSGILHRDIKPANILMDDYDRPALTDFGIASGTTDGEAAGLSIPWSPPESFASPSVSVPQSDVWALGATLYSLLTARSPFEVPGRANGSAELITRLQTAPLPPLGRADAPPLLQTTLEIAMAKRIEGRYSTALQFAHALQRVESELGLRPTPVQVKDEQPRPERRRDDDDGATRIRGITSIAAQAPAPAPAPTRAPAAPATQAASADPTLVRPASRWVTPPPAGGASAPALPHAVPGRLPEAPELTRTVLKAPTAPAPGAAGAAGEASLAPSGPAARRRRTPLLIAAAVVVVIAAGGIAAAFAVHPSAAKATGSHTVVPAPQNVAPASVPAPTKLVGKKSADGAQVTFTWTDPAPEPGDAYLWSVVTPGAQGSTARVTTPTVTVPAGSGETCVQVAVVRTNGTSSAQPATECVQ